MSHHLDFLYVPSCPEIFSEFITSQNTCNIKRIDLCAEWLSDLLKVAIVGLPVLVLPVLQLFLHDTKLFLRRSFASWNTVHEETDPRVFVSWPVICFRRYWLLWRWFLQIQRILGYKIENTQMKFPGFTAIQYGKEFFRYQYTCIWCSNYGALFNENPKIFEHAGVKATFLPKTLLQIYGQWKIISNFLPYGHRKTIKRVTSHVDLPV